MVGPVMGLSFFIFPPGPSIGETIGKVNKGRQVIFTYFSIWWRLLTSTYYIESAMPLPMQRTCFSPSSILFVMRVATPLFFKWVTPVKTMYLLSFVRVFLVMFPGFYTFPACYCWLFTNVPSFASKVNE